MADNEKKAAEEQHATSSAGAGSAVHQQTATGSAQGNQRADDDKKDVEKRGQATRRGPFKDKSDRNEKSGSLDFDVHGDVSVLGGYMEEGTVRPEPFYQYGTFDTSGTGGGAPDMSEVSPVFQEARARGIVNAARALDPHDPAVPRELVTLPERYEDREPAADLVFAAAQEAVENPIELGGMTPAQREAAEEYDDDAGGRASLGGQVGGSGVQGKRHDQKASLRDWDGDGAKDTDELKQDFAEAKATVTQGSTGRQQQAATQQGAQQAKGR